MYAPKRAPRLLDGEHSWVPPFIPWTLASVSVVVSTTSPTSRVVVVIMPVVRLAVAVIVLVATVVVVSEASLLLLSSLRGRLLLLLNRNHALTRKMLKLTTGGVTPTEPLVLYFSFSGHF